MGNYDGLRWNMHGLWPNLKMDGYCLSVIYKEIFIYNF
jgi:hypothetical protein